MDFTSFHTSSIVWNDERTMEGYLGIEWDETSYYGDLNVDEILEASDFYYSTTPHNFTESFVQMPNPHSRKLESFSFEERRYLIDVYNCMDERILLKCGRQVEKSTTLGNKILSYSGMIPHFKTLFVSPSSTQTKEFSKTRIKGAIDTSPDLQAWFDQSTVDNVFEKSAINFSKIVLRYAFLNADRVRGVSADFTCIDEIQDIYLDLIPVIEEASSHSPFKWFLYSGTPKSLDNPIEYLWTNNSTQNEWAVPCDRHGVKSDPSTWHWNILTENNITRDYLACDKCGREIRPNHPLSQWVSTGDPDPDGQVYQGFRIPQLMTPWIKWEDLWAKYNDYPRVQFYNEVLGESYDSGERPLTLENLKANCNSVIDMNEEAVIAFRAAHPTARLYAGIDWGSDSNKSYTVIVICTYINNRFTLIYAYRFTGQEASTHVQIAKIKKLLALLRVHRAGTDYGGGVWPNDQLLREFGSNRILRYQYASAHNIVEYSDKLGRFIVNRTEIMTIIFNGIKRNDTFTFPSWLYFKEPFGSDFLSIFSEYNEKRRMVEYKKSVNDTDDTFHAFVTCFLASLVDTPRPDLIIPSSVRDHAIADSMY